MQSKKALQNWYPLALTSLTSPEQAGAIARAARPVHIVVMAHALARARDSSGR
jgi:hypothetical protein